MRQELARITDIVLARSGEALTPATLLFLVRRYPEVPSPALHAALDRTLSAALPAFDAESDACVRWRWLGAFVEAAPMIADGALSDAVDARMADAVDALERHVRLAYEPGEGAGESAAGDILLALALLAAFDLTARLPYAMLAEELLQSVQRRIGSAPSLAFDADAVSACRAVQVCCRLAALHRDADYTARAVVAPGAAYDVLAKTLLEGRMGQTYASVEAAAECGLALLDWFALRALPH